MARGFGPTFGSGTTDIIKTGYSTALAIQHSVSAWVFINGTGGGNLGRIYEQNASGNPNPPSLGLTGNTATLLIAMPWTLTANNNAQWNASAPSTGAWHHLCMTYDGSSTSNKPSVYVNGVAVTVTQTVAPVGAYLPVSQQFVIGNVLAANRNWDGKLAEIGVWNSVILSASEAAALANRVPARFVRPSQLSLYFPLFGTQANEPDWGPSHVTQTITGTAKQNHAPVTTYVPPTPTSFSANAVITAVMTAYQGVNVASISVTESITTAMTSWQQANYAQLSMSELILAAITAYQQSDNAALSLTETITASMAAAQGTDLATISVNETIRTVLAGYQRSNYAALSAHEIIEASVNAFQSFDFARIIIPGSVERGYAATSNSLLFAAGSSNAMVYGADPSDSLASIASTGDQQVSSSSSSDGILYDTVINDE